MTTIKAGDELRAAAKLMRERAEAATPGPWEASGGVVDQAVRRYALEIKVEYGGLTNAELYRRMAKRMHPDTGAPRADWDRLAEARRILAEAGGL